MNPSYVRFLQASYDFDRIEITSLITDILN